MYTVYTHRLDSTYAIIIDNTSDKFYIVYTDNVMLHKFPIDQDNDMFRKIWHNKKVYNTITEVIQIYPEMINL